MPTDTLLPAKLEHFYRFPEMRAQLRTAVWPAKAMKDYDYMLECSKRPWDSFLATGEREVDHYLTWRVISKIVNDGFDAWRCETCRHCRTLGEYDGRPIGRTRNSTTEASWLKSLATASSWPLPERFYC